MIETSQANGGERRRGAPPPAAHRPGGALVRLALVGLVALLLAALAAPPLLGYRAYVIYGGSMEPAIEIGSLIVARPVSTEDLRVGDVVVFESPSNGVTLTHRIIEVRHEDGRTLFRTKGDASSAGDPLEQDFGGGAQRVAFHIPYVGYFVDFARSPLGMLLLLALPAAGLAALTFLGGSRKKRGEEAPGQA